VGDPAPPFAAPADSDAPSTLLVFTEAGCGACETLKPDLAAWQAQHADRLAIVTVSGQPELTKAYQVNATPSAVLVSGGKIASALAEGADDIRKLVRRSTLPPPAKKGDAVPALRLPDLDGAEVNLASFRGRRTLVLFWSTTCGFCQQMLEDVKKWERARPANSPELLIISSGTPEANRQQGFHAPVLLDADWGAGTVLGAGGTPSALIIDEEGKVASDVGVGGPAVLELAGASAK
jgi:thiol-disulfide isomerase/thioredoxin